MPFLEVPDSLVSPCTHFIFLLGQPNRKILPTFNLVFSSQVDIYSGFVISLLVS